jgi:hypothetical protein
LPRLRPLPLPRGRLPSLLPPLSSSLETASGFLVLHATAQHVTAQHSMPQHSMPQHSMSQHGTACHSTAQHINSVRHSRVAESTAQHRTAPHTLQPPHIPQMVAYEPCQTSALAPHKSVCGLHNRRAVPNACSQTTSQPT